MQAQIFTFLRGKQMKLSCVLCSRYICNYVCTMHIEALRKKCVISGCLASFIMREFSLAYYVDPLVAGGVSKGIHPNYLKINLLDYCIFILTQSNSYTFLHYCNNRSLALVITVSLQNKNEKYTNVSTKVI